MKDTQEQRSIELEMRLTEQDQTLQTMSDEIFAQQKKLDNLDATCKILHDKISLLGNDSAATGAADEKPPHY